MQKIDFEHLDGQSQVARSRDGRMGKMVLPFLLVTGAGILAYVNWPAGSSETSLTDKSTETFETAGGGVNNFPDLPPKQAADPNLVTLPVPDNKPAPATQVNVSVNPGIDLEKQRLLLEAQMRAEEARRRAEEEARRAAEEAKRREAEEKAYWERMRSGLIIVDGETRSNDPGASAVTVASDGQLVTVAGVDSDANKAFLAQSEKATAGMVKATRFARTDALVAQGTLIRGFLETAINTDLPGMVRAVVREDVRSLDGRRVLIPKGARLVGEYKSGLARGQKRVFIVWSRVNRSDGLSVEIASPGADRLGRAGMGGTVDTHFWERFGSAIMLSVIGGAAEFVAALGDTASTGNQSVSTTDPATGITTTVTTQPGTVATEARSIAAEKTASILQEIATEAFKDSSKIPPTIYIPQGEQIVVFVRRDLDFSDFYADPVREEMMRLRNGGVARRAVDPTPYYPDVPVYK